MNNKGFSLIELLVVIAIIATITAIAIVGLNRARDQSIASKTLNDLKAVEKGLSALMLDEKRSIWWRDTDFGAGADPSIDNITNLDQFMPSIPTPEMNGVSTYNFDNDGDTLAASSNDLNGVNIIMTFATSSVSRDKYFNLMDIPGDYNSGNDNGKLRTNGTDIIFYNLVPNEGAW